MVDHRSITQKKAKSFSDKLTGLKNQPYRAQATGGKYANFVR